MSPFKRSLIRLLCLLMIAAAVSGRPEKSKRVAAKKNSDHRLIGGELVQRREFPFIVSLRVMPKELHRCGGFLLSRTHVVTTASCIYSAKSKELHAYLEPLKLDSMGVYVKASHFDTHPNFTLTPHEHDIAIVTLMKPVGFRFPAVPDWVELPSKMDVFTFGWGYEKGENGVTGNFMLHKIKLQVMPNGICTLVLREYLGCDTVCGTSPTEFATGAADVGTPLIYIGNTGQMFAVGMLVKESDDLVNAAPYMRLRQYRDWINGIMTFSPSSTTTEITTINPEETTTTEATEAEAGSGSETQEGESGFSEDYHEQPIKGRSRKRSDFEKKMFRDPSRNRHISPYG